MPDFAMNVHFRTQIGSEAHNAGFAGGYGWFLGRFEAFDIFEQRLRKELNDLGYYFVEYDAAIEVRSDADLNSGEQQELFRNLTDYPIQYRTVHMYEKDDA